MFNSTKARFATILGMLGLMSAQPMLPSAYHQPKEFKSRGRNNGAQKRQAAVLRIARNRSRNKAARASRTFNRVSA